MDTVECRELIVSTLKRRGAGCNLHDPVRIITEVYEKDGTKIAENDPCPEHYFAKDLIKFAKWAKETDLDIHTLDIMAVDKWMDSKIKQQ